MEFSSCSLQAETWRDAIWLMIWNSLINLNPRNRQSRGAASQGGKEDAGRLGCELHDIRGGNTPKVSKSSGTPFCRRPGWGAHKGDSPAPLCLWHQLGNLSTRNLFWEAIAEVPRIKKKNTLFEALIEIAYWQESSAGGPWVWWIMRDSLFLRWRNHHVHLFCCWCLSVSRVESVKYLHSLNSKNIHMKWLIPSPSWGTFCSEW